LGQYGPNAPARKTTVVTATETEYKITLNRKTFKPGAYRFMVVNHGKLTHSLAINGPGVSHKRTAHIKPGGSAQLSVTLKKGTYRLTCPIDAHTALGMKLTIHVR
jgi:plastocyanin